MNLNPIGLAVPIFFLLMAVEFLLAKRRKVDVYRLNDTMADLSCGMGDQLIALVLKVWVVFVYGAVYQSASLCTWDTASVWTWVLGFIGVDLCYYTYHRFSHRVNIGWATHVVHHQSEEYNLAVALRQPWFSMAISWVFYLPLALIGFPVTVYLTAYAFNLLYQFWIHTRLIGRMGPFGWIFNTPSHHRVHHGTNPQYIDKNYGGILIIWDRIFGTFAEEVEEPKYGVSKPIRTWNAFRANVEPITHLIRRACSYPRRVHGLKLFVKPPDWTPAGFMEIRFPSSGRGYDRAPTKALKVYTMIHLVPVGLITAFMLTFDKTLSWSFMTIASLYISGSLAVWAGFFEQKPWSYPAEIGRLISMVLASGILAINQTHWFSWSMGALTIVGLLSLVWFASRGRGFVLRGTNKDLPTEVATSAL